MSNIHIIHQEGKHQPIVQLVKSHSLVSSNYAWLISSCNGGLQFPVCGMWCVCGMSVCPSQSKHLCTFSIRYGNPWEPIQDPCLGSQDIQSSCGCKMVRVAMVLALKWCRLKVLASYTCTTAIGLQATHSSKQNMDKTGRIEWSEKQRITMNYLCGWSRLIDLWIKIIKVLLVITCESILTYFKVN